MHPKLKQVPVLLIHLARNAGHQAATNGEDPKAAIAGVVTAYRQVPTGASTQGTRRASKTLMQPKTADIHKALSDIPVLAALEEATQQGGASR